MSGSSESQASSAMSVKPARLDSVDILRGAIMVIMALDHVRDYFTNVRFDPLDLEKTTAALFMTRWVTHFCAPVFVFLAGTGAFLSLSRGKSKRDVSWLLVTRGFWLILLELTWVRFGWLFNLDYSLIILQVIWAIGWSMVVLAALVHLSIRSITIFGLVLIALHNAFDRVSSASVGMFGWPWQILHVSSAIQHSGYSVWVAYPLIPWIGVMAVGYGFGSLLLRGAPERRKLLTRIGLGATAAFVVLRFVDVYGDANHWTHQQSVLLTFFDFIDTTKYPPSLLYLLMTLGPAIALLPFLENAKGKIAGFFIVFGRVPMFFYLLHIPLIHALAVVAAMASGFDVSYMFGNTPPWLWPAGYGFGLPGVYVAWGGVVLLLYPACKWFGGLKKRRKDAWLSYI